ncbi:MerR family DNA-binding protein [Streptomyces xantholiticus]
MRADRLWKSAARPATGSTHVDVELLTFIRRARALGLRLEDVHEVLEIRRGGTPPCDAVRDLLDARIAEIDATPCGRPSARPARPPKTARAKGLPPSARSSKRLEGAVTAGGPPHAVTSFLVRMP